MLRARVFKRLHVLLILLILADSSLALELVAHNAMPDTANQTSMHHGSHSMAGAEHGDSHAPNPWSDTAEPDNAEECFCDEFCCVSSVNLPTDSNGLACKRLLDDAVMAPEFYQSINLDLQPPPPIR